MVVTRINKYVMHVSVYVFSFIWISLFFSSLGEFFSDPSIFIMQANTYHSYVLDETICFLITESIS